MADYRLYLFENGHIVKAEDISALDDFEAVRKAAALVDEKPAELWSGPRKVRIFNPIA
jgi:hypothetical protein